MDDKFYKQDQWEIWDAVENGRRPPIDIIYVLKDLDPEELESIEQWGSEITGLFYIEKVKSVKGAIKLNQKQPTDVFVLNDCWVEEARLIADSSPQTPICIARSGGFNSFDFSIFPPQVINAMWAAPREGEFMNSIADALSKVATRRIYEATQPKIEVVKFVSNELLAKLAEFPEERFNLNPRLFEEIVAELLHKMGYEVQLTPRTGDKGRDVIAAYKTPTAPILMLVECKRYAPNRFVGPEPITRLWYRLFDDHANMAMVVTTSQYQPVAHSIAKDRGYQISLKDGDDFIKWIRNLKTT